MAVVKIFPIKDTFISSHNPFSNYGRDEILDIRTGLDSTSRALIQFDTDEISQYISLSNNAFSSSLKLFLANSYQIPDNFSFVISPLSQSWIMGTGREGDFHNPQNGACWNYPNPNSPNIPWNEWLSVPSQYVTSQSFNYTSTKDINCNVTDMVLGWNNNDINNYGLLLKFDNISESSSLNYFAQFFSMDTHTIYPPHLELYWNDVSYSSSLPLINNTLFVSNIINNRSEFEEDSIYTFRIKSRDLYPIRQFQTSSLYLNNKILPEESFWALKDMKTEEIVIDYHSLGTKIGGDDNGNYFTIYMNGLQPERYYQILIKTTINEDIVIIENNNNYFKVTR